MRFIEKMKEDKLTLVVSCPRNEYDYARLAWENGADAVKIHLNVDHFASGTKFGTLAEEMDFVSKVLQNCPVPVGVVVGGDTTRINDDFLNVLEQDFDFLSLYVHDATPLVMNQNKITKMLACNDTYTHDEIKRFESLGVEILEASVINASQYGTPLNMRDILKYRTIRELVDIPMLLPTQKKVKTSELKDIQDAGFNGIMIGAVTTTLELDTYAKVIKQFRTAIDSL